MALQMRISNNQRNSNLPLAWKGRFLASFFLLALWTSSNAQVFRESLEQVLVEGQWINAFRSHHEYVNGRRVKVTTSSWGLQAWEPCIEISYTYDGNGRLTSYLVKGDDNYYREHYRYDLKGALIEMWCDSIGARSSPKSSFMTSRKYWRTINYRYDANNRILTSSSDSYQINGDYCYETNGRMMLVTCVEKQRASFMDYEYNWLYIASQSPPGVARKYNQSGKYVPPANARSAYDFYYNGDGYPLQYYTDPQETPGNPMHYFSIARYTVKRREHEDSPFYRGYSGWIDTYRFTFSYDSSSGKLWSDIEEDYKITNYPHEGAWQFKDKNEYHYDAEGRCAEVLYSIWQDSAGWLPSRRITFSYDQTVPSMHYAQENDRMQKDVKLANYPNPFNSETRIHFELPISSEICVSTFDLSGSEIKRLVDRIVLAAGVHEITWDGADSNGRPVPSGVYFIKVRLNNTVAQTKRCLLIK